MHARHSASSLQGKRRVGRQASQRRYRLGRMASQSRCWTSTTRKGTRRRWRSTHRARSTWRKRGDRRRSAPSLQQVCGCVACAGVVMIVRRAWRAGDGRGGEANCRRVLHRRGGCGDVQAKEEEEKGAAQAGSRCRAGSRRAGGTCVTRCTVAVNPCATRLRQQQRAPTTSDHAASEATASSSTPLHWLKSPKPSEPSAWAYHCCSNINNHTGLSTCCSKPTMRPWRSSPRNPPRRATPWTTNCMKALSVPKRLRLPKPQ